MKEYSLLVKEVYDLATSDQHLNMIGGQCMLFRQATLFKKSIYTVGVFLRLSVNGTFNKQRNGKSKNVLIYVSPFVCLSVNHKTYQRFILNCKCFYYFYYWSFKVGCRTFFKSDVMNLFCNLMDNLRPLHNFTKK